MFNFGKNKIILTLVGIFIFGFWLRSENIKGANVVFDFDQIEDQFYTYKIAVEGKLPIIGRAIYGDARIHHGVFYYYYNLIPFLLSKGNLYASLYWNILFNTATSLILFILAKSMFKKTLPALLTALIAVSSFEFIKFSNWLTIDTVAIFTVPLFYLGLWLYYQNIRLGLILALVGLGLSIQADLSFLYLFPILIIFWLIFRPKMPSLKLFLFSCLVFILTISTLILTELKLNFTGIKILLNFSQTEQAKLTITSRLQLFSQAFWKDFSNNLLPQRSDLGVYIGVIIILGALYWLFSKKISSDEKKGIYFLFLYLFSPAITLLVGYHDKPWFLIGLPPAIALISGYVISKLKQPFLILAILIIGISNISFILNRPFKAYQLFDSIYDSTSYLTYQLQVVDYTYRQSNGQPFSINAVTYPLYYNGLWAYLYFWYGKGKYGYVPSWLGGDQLHPYDLLPKATGQKKFYLLISETGRIPEIYKTLGKDWAKEHGRLIEEKAFNGFTVLSPQVVNPKARTL